jgi:hypothetical protein
MTSNSIKKDKLHKRHLRKRQKEYLRLERQTVRRQKRELTKLKNRYRLRSFQRFIKNLLDGILFRDGKKSTADSSPSRPKVAYGRSQKPSGPPSPVFKRKEGRLKTLRQDRKKVVQERKRARENRRMLRRKIRSQRNQQRKKDLQNFLKNPFLWQRMKGSEKILKRQIRLDLKQQRRKNLVEFPSRIQVSFKRFIETRKRTFRYRIKRMEDLFSPITRSSTTERLMPDLLVNFLNSTAMFLIAFWIIFYFMQLVSIFAAHRFTIPAVWYSFKVDWPLYTYSVVYSRRALVIIFGTGPFLVFLFSILFFRLQKKVARRSTIAALLITWLLFHSVNQVFGGLISGLVTRTGFARTTEWLFLTRPFDTVELSLLVVSAVVLIFAGFYGTRLFLRIGQNSRFIEPRVRSFYILFQVLLPWISGTLLLYISNVPRNPPELIILYAISFLMILPMLTNYNAPQLRSVKLSNPLNNSRILWAAIFSVLIGFVLIRTLLFPGIPIH